MKNYISKYLLYSEALSPKAYLNLSPEEKSNIVNSEIIPACIGENHFGKIKVFYRAPKETKFF